MRSNESPSGAFKRQSSLRKQMEGLCPDKLCGPLQTHFHGRGRGGERQVQRRFLRKRGAAGDEPSPSSLRDATSPERGRFCSTYWQGAKSSPFGGAGERSEPERVGSLPEGAGKTVRF